MDDEIYLQICEDAATAANEVDYHMCERDRESFIEKYIERELASRGLTHD